MCGIFGGIGIGHRFSVADYDRFVALTDMVAYRGPDGSGYCAFGPRGPVSPEAGFETFLGHRRLSIIDLSTAANQPMTDDCTTVVFNGQIYNYLELAEELRAAGHSFRTKSDTEVLLKVYREWGVEGFWRLNGMWAFALLDLRQRRLVLSRDRFSMKPLYTIRTREGLFFSSEIKQLLPLLPQKRMNRRVMHRFLAQAIRDDGEETFFEGVSQVPPKHSTIVDLDSGATRRHQYWEYSPLARDLDDGDAVDEFAHVFTDSVRLRLRSDVGVGTLLSGGLDSSAVTVVAAEVSTSSLRSYSLAADEDGYHERGFIDIARQPVQGWSNTTYRLAFDGPETVADTLSRVLYVHDEPFASLTVLAQFQLMSFVRETSDTKVLLSGQGGDEGLLGYRKYFLFYLRQLARAGAVSTLASELLLSLVQRTMLWQFNLADAARYTPWLRDHGLRACMRESEPSEPIWECASLRGRQILDLDRFSVPALTHYEDRASMAHGLEIRLPFLDHRLVDFLVNLPARLKIRRGWSKFILRKAMTRLPDPIRWRRDKQGYLIPEKLWLLQGLEPLIRTLFRNSLLDEMGVLDAKRFLAYYDRFRSGSRQIWPEDITRALLAEMWAREHWPPLTTTAPEPCAI